MLTFRKIERLSGKKSFNELFQNGKSFRISDLQVFWIIVSEKDDSPVKVSISVSKKRFKKAVDRNLIKRRIKEAYRINKDILYTYIKNNPSQVNFIIIYSNNKILDFLEIEKQVIATLKKLVNKLSNAI